MIIMAMPQERLILYFWAAQYALPEDNDECMYNHELLKLSEWLIPVKVHVSSADVFCLGWYCLVHCYSILFQISVC